MIDDQNKQNADIAMQWYDKHLCLLMFEGFHEACREEYKQMVQDAQFRCENCGRTAHRQVQLCNPVSL